MALIAVAKDIQSVRFVIRRAALNAAVIAVLEYDAQPLVANRNLERRSYRELHVRFARLPGSKITAPALGWVEVSVIRSDIPAVVVAESFSTCACTWIVW